MQNLATFQVYNASAGSGKTFTLVKEYLKILLQSEDIFRFQKILAITFTNKAAGEMKERVMKNLQAFSKGEQTDMYAIILEEASVDKEVLKERSTKIIDAILQNYSAFSITTIDSFTHKIIKNFAYDLGLTLNFEVEMDATSLLSEAVDVLVSKIGTDDEVTKLLLDFSFSKIDEDKSWDITRELNEFSKILLNEDDVTHFRKLSDKTITDFNQLHQKLTKQQKEITQRLKEIGAEGLQVIETMGVDHKDFYYALLPKHFVALQKEPAFAKFFDQSKLRERIEENMFYSKSKSEDVKTAIEEILPTLLELYMESEQLYRQMLLNQLVLKSIIPLAVLNNINSELNTIKEENNIRLNAEFNQLISDNIKDQPAPFIYERLGQKFMHYFIDEMQDTSVLQWKNLIPLIDNALAQENSNLLLVGDGKQAIYRWRGGKAEQFIELGSSEQNAKAFHIPKEVKELSINYRSYSEVINFNNDFFQYTASYLQNEAYKNMFVEGNRQIENTKKGGYVSISFVEKEGNKEADENIYPKKVLAQIKELQQQFSLGEICVLTRKRKDGIEVANYLSENGISIVSSETLLLKNSPKVNFITNVLQIIQHPNDEETRFEMLYFLQEHLQVVEEKHTFLNSLAKKTIHEIFSELRKYKVYIEVEVFLSLPFYEKIEEIIRSFKLIETSDAYVQFFLDLAIDQQRKGTSVQDFLDYWNDKKESLSIVAPKTADAVQIMTIHKSKGLEFPVVIFPYDLNIYQQINPKAWLNNLPEQYAGFDELLVDYSQKLSYINDSGAEIYQQQQEELELDNFNLLYVALTRAVEQLYVITEKRLTKEGANTNYYSGIFIEYLQYKNLWEEAENDFYFGDKKRGSVVKKDKISGIEQEIFVSTPWDSHNIQMLASSSKLWDTEQGKAIDYGNLVHQMMAEVYVDTDIEKVVVRYENVGAIPKELSLAIKKAMKDIVSHPQLKPYFSANVMVYNERELVSVDNQILIPDRLMYNGSTLSIIDYKTGKPNKKYHQQVMKYANLLQNMKYTVEKKLLVYIDEEILVEEV